MSGKDCVLDLYNFDVKHEPDHPKYLCLGGRLHVVTATKIILWLELFTIPVFGFLLSPQDQYLALFVLHIVHLTITLCAVIMEKYRWMWPFVIYATLQFIAWSSISTLKLFFRIVSDNYILEEFGQGYHDDPYVRWGIVTLIKAIALFLSMFLFWRMSIVYTAKKYFEAQQRCALNIKDPETEKWADNVLKPF